MVSILCGNAREFLHEVLRRRRRSELAAHLPEMKRGEQQRGELAGEGFGGGDADFRAGVRVDRAVGFAREHGADHIADGQNFRALLAGFALGGERVGRFAGLADGDDQTCACRGWDRDSGIRCRSPLRRERCASRSIMNFPARPACQLVPQATILTSRKLRNSSSVMSISSRKTLPVSCEMRPSRVSRTARGCSKISFCMKCLKPPFSAMIGSQVMCWACGSIGLAFEIGEADALRREHGDFAIAEEKNAARVRENRGNIAGDEEFVFAKADDDRRAEARGDDFVAGPCVERATSAYAPLITLTALQDGFFERRVLRNISRAGGR